MDSLTLLIVIAPPLAVIALFLSWDRPFFRNRTFRFGLGAAFLLVTAFCAVGMLASSELNATAALAWRLRYLVLGSFTLAASLYCFLKHPVLIQQNH